MSSSNRNNNQPSDDNGGDDFKRFMDDVMERKIPGNYIHNKRAKQKVFGKHVFEDCITDKYDAFLILKDLSDSSGYTILYNIFRGDHSHKVADNFKYALSQARRNSSSINATLDWRADQDISKLIATAILNHREIRDYLITHPKMFDKIKVYLSKEDATTISTYFAAVTDTEIKQFFSNLVRENMINFYGDENLVRKMFPHLFMDENEKVNSKPRPGS